MQWSLDKEIDSVRSEFPILEKCVYLISNSLGAVPKKAQEKLLEFYRMWAEEGVGSWQKKWWELKVSSYQELIEALSVKGTPYVYSLLSFTSKDKKIDLKIKKKPPRPNSKNPEDSALGGKLKFCILKIPKTPEILKTIIETFAKDFVDEIPIKWKSLIIQNTYEITNLIFPEKKEGLSSRKFRLNTLREGKLNRVATIDSIDHSNSVEFKV